jgi:hypothetical protein
MKRGARALRSKVAVKSERVTEPMGAGFTTPALLIRMSIWNLLSLVKADWARWISCSGPVGVVMSTFASRVLIECCVWSSSAREVAAAVEASEV